MLSSDNHVRVLYIAGYRRSGSTVLHNLLGQINDFFAVGELRNIWSHGLARNVDCGCGRRFANCPFWKKVVAEAFGSAQNINAGAMVRTTRQAIFRRLPLLAFSRGRVRLRSQFAGYIRRLAVLYKAVQSISGCRVIVDSSKVPLYAHLLSCASGIDVRVLHLTRDARGAIFSCITSGLPARPLAWDGVNIGAEMLRRYSGIPYTHQRYEDFCRRPQHVTADLLRWMNEEQPLPFVDGKTFYKRPTHSVAGNPSRRDTGRTEIRASDAWKREMNTKEVVTTTALTGPLLARYGYALWPG